MEFSELVQRFAAAAAAGDGDKLAELFTPDGTYDDYFFGPSTGRDAIKAMLAHFGEGGRNFRWEFFDPVRAGGVGYASYRFSFDSTRPEAEGARVVFDGIGRFDLEGDRIRRYSEVFDRGMALAQQAFEGERLRKIGAQVCQRLEGAPGMAGAFVRRGASRQRVAAASAACAYAATSRPSQRLFPDALRPLSLSLLPDAHCKARFAPTRTKLLRRYA